MSALIAGGTPGEVVNLGLAGAIVISTPRSVVHELEAVLLHKLGLLREQVESGLGRVGAALDLVEPFQVDEAVPGEDVDNQVLAVAVQVGADFVVTGDRRHLIPLGDIKGIPILTPAEFLAEYYRSNPEP